MIQYTLEVQGLDKLNDSFQRAPQITMKHLTLAMNKSLVKLQATAKELAPVDTNRLRNSILISPAVVTGNTITGSVGTNVTYSVFQEAGTGIYGPLGRPITPKTKKVLAWQGKGGDWHYAKQVKGVRPKYYMKGSLEQNTEAVNGYFAQASDDIVAELGGS